jgi:hypothetical protein
MEIPRRKNNDPRGQRRFFPRTLPFCKSAWYQPGVALELGTTAGFLHEPIYNKLVSIYNDSTHASQKTVVVNHDIYVTSGIKKEVPATFDELSPSSVSQGMDFLNKHYRQARRWQLQFSNYEPFDAYCGNWHYLLLYHNSLLECGDQVLLSLVFPKFPDSVKRSSLYIHKQGS